jgi:hypothetical protein
LAATIDFAKTMAIATLAGVGVSANMQMALPVCIGKQKTRRPRGTFALTETTSALIYP